MKPEPPENWEEDVVRLQEENRTLTEMLDEITSHLDDEYATTREKVARMKKAMKRLRDPRSEE